ncbi:hypothetical protein D0T92_01215 [Neisseria zalophi]|uniref:Uncharacterized protein n=1 Tax=Neisseria zalophi TaxID=640030 RepID=A0A5J6PSM7_9NEIS|nr:hypothetical protein D0T92_01215 [Neisseria zalophi]
MMDSLILSIAIPVGFLWVFFYWYCAYSIYKKYNTVNSFIDFLFVKNIEANKFIWGIVLNKSTITIEKDYKFYVVKYGVRIFLIIFIILLFKSIFIY